MASEDEIDDIEQESTESTEDEAEIAFGEDEDGAAEDEGEPVIAFADETGAEDEGTPLVKHLREQIRTLQRKARHAPASGDADDPEPAVPELPNALADFDYDEDRYNAAIAAHYAAKADHTAWKARQSEREETKRRQADEQTRQVEQQKKALGVSDYEDRAARVREALSDAQLAVLINGAGNPAQLIYALGRSQNRLDMLAGEENLAKFAVMIGAMERDVKVQKRKAPEPESRVRGATGSVAVSSDKQLERLEREADKTGDRTKVQAYKRQLRQQRAA